MRPLAILPPLFLTLIAPAFAAEPVKLTKQQVEEVKRTTSRDMRDPASAVFSNIRGGRTADGMLIACGLVNGRNGYGGMVGNSPFFGTWRDGTYRTAVTERADGSLGVGAMCARLGIPVE